ncbi:hypothetical protein WDU94_013432, partial [Cyamophila willieti]
SSSEVFFVVNLVLGLIWSSVSAYYNNVAALATRDPDIQRQAKYFMMISQDDDFKSDKVDWTFTGTKWCGPENIAENYNDLGTAVETDKCCRDHDHCTEIIKAKDTKHGLTNNSPYTRVHCRCEIKFYDCLRSLRTTPNTAEDQKTSGSVGQLYFNLNLWETQCFKEDYPIVNCSKKYPNTTRCATYEQDTTKPIIWQWFDVPIYYPE